MRTAPLGEVAKIERNSIQAADIEAGMKYVGLEDVDGETGALSGAEVENGELSSSKFKFTDEHILYGKLRPYLKKISRPNFEGICSTDILPIRPGSEIHKDYLFWYLRQQSVVDQVNSMISGANLPRISPKLLETIPIPIIKIDEQKRIASILDHADNLRRTRRQAIEKLNSLSQSIFYKMFGDPVKNEKKWKIEKLHDLAVKICSGSTPVGGKNVYVSQGIFFLRSQNVWRKKLELDDVVYIDETTHKKMNKTSLRYGDILITKTGRINTENSSLGRAALFLGEDNSTNINGHVYLIRLKPEVLNEFVLHIITTLEYREYIRSVCVGGIDKRQINKEHLEEFPIIYPPIEAQHVFLKCLTSIEKQKSRFFEQLEFSETLFLSLQQRAFRGEL